ncbi:septum site-determining protein MinC [Paenactinomyces guangxiensis]|uniref:Probable septum site-determining protein MinC n=1 Tax=Paenactinomyces guangxiensis TaxID=1490290 RepID=A0A7W2AAD4_9BACL|nr:septum site-determining protein MinC [Paenactinomyces guangxiensis]MBA4496157.1 septum site-determining protein MinC [Paenactinomyces guangxiensis]MBH8593245.1 septum site-determining protein MinC [Paenactinomyces guangxiensis]
MGKVLKQGVTIKGTKDGLLFFLDDSRPFSAVLKELKYKLEQNNASHIWDGPEMKVKIKLGQRQISKPEEIAVRELFSIRKNLIIHEFESEGMPYLLDRESGIEMLSGTVRSGQVLTHTGDILLLGDVNPGGTIQSTGSIYVMGAIRGLAHAGSKGDETAIIAASILRPTQLRIADVISRPPDQWDESEVNMRFAYLVNNQIAVEKMHHLSRIRPDQEWKENNKRP